MMVLGMVEGKVYYRYGGEQSQRQGPLEEYSVQDPELCEERERGEPGAAARSTKGTKRVGNQNGW